MSKRKTRKGKKKRKRKAKNLSCLKEIIELNIWSLELIAS